MAANGDNGTPPSTPGPKAAGGGSASLTARESEILAKVMTCLKAPPEVDYEKLAAEVGMTNPRSASNAWAAIKKKMNWNLKATDTPASGKSTGGAKRKKSVAINNGNGNSDDDEDASPSKKAKTPSKPRKKATATPKKGKASAAAHKSPAVAKDSSEDEEMIQDKQGSEDVKMEQKDESVQKEEANNDGEV